MSLDYLVNVGHQMGVIVRAAKHKTSGKQSFEERIPKRNRKWRKMLGSGSIGGTNFHPNCVLTDFSS